ncbi:hypothetical protein QJS10_CPB22g00238 [Acorus calamus]|uniref:Uncharacterized protein n=1 Tax=Acorus calamus TaxID=4465 RepID=A0AAV9C1X2_ACOCL|nr:hypothetical protein QJS10_CPB22g00238 [Acorus calamus]
MALSIGFTVLSGLPMTLSPKITPSSQTKLKVSSIATQNEGGNSSVVVAVPRRSGNYNPSLWDHSFIQSLKNDYTGDIYINRAGQLKEEVRNLFDKTMEPLARLELIFTLQNLGIAYHFKKEIKESLLNILNNKDDVLEKKDLHATSLLFMLLRGHGFEASQVNADIFQSFKKTSGDFMDSLCDDIKGMLSLYEASYLGFEGEKTLDEARAFTAKFLEEYLKQDEINPILKEQVVHSLELPRHWRVTRIDSNWYMDIYERQGDVNPILLEFAKLDFNLVQSTHQADIRKMSRWWMDLGLAEKLGYARDRVMEHFFWTVGWLCEPQFSNFRETLTKVNCLITCLDDTYDVYGSLDELTLFTDAVNRWELNESQNLPEYMKILISALFKTTEEIAEEIFNQKGVDVLSCLKKGWADLCNSYFVEAEWYHSGYTPTFDEYLNNAWISISDGVLMGHAYFYVTEDITNEALDGLKNYNGILRWSSILFRLIDDLGTSKHELQRGDVPKAVECYMLEKGVSEEVAVEHIRGIISKAWKKMNKEYAAPSLFHREFVEVCMNEIRMAQCMYQYGDGHGCPEQYGTKNRIMFSLIQPIPLNLEYNK